MLVAHLDVHIPHDQVLDAHITSLDNAPLTTASTYAVLTIRGKPITIHIFSDIGYVNSFTQQLRHIADGLERQVKACNSND